MNSHVVTSLFCGDCVQWNKEGFLQEVGSPHDLHHVDPAQVGVQNRLGGQLFADDCLNACVMFAIYACVVASPHT